MPQEIIFALGSCQYPAGLLDRTVAEASYGRLAALLQTRVAPTPTYLLLVGDQVYVDASAGLFDPTTRYDRFIRPHERLLRMNPFRLVVSPILRPYMMLDDHEIEDNWEPVADDPASREPMVEGRRAYLQYQRTHLPLPPLSDPDQLWCTPEFGGFPLFLADTRTERTTRTAQSIHGARIMSDVQFQALLDWLDEQQKNAPDLPKFVASPAILLPRRLRATHRGHPASALRSDAWDGYPGSLHRLLAHIADQQIRNVVFLSGDEHLSCVTRGEITAPSGKKARIHSVHSSPLYGPFPFANSRREDLAGRETFTFGGGYACRVITRFGPAGDGFAVLHIRQSKGVWQLASHFDRANGSRAINCRLA